MRRRIFIKSVGSLSLGAFSLQKIPHNVSGDTFGISRKDLLFTNDTDYWKIIRRHFPLTYKRAFFNTGGIGASPYIVIDAVKKKIDELEEIGEVGRSQAEWDSIKSKIAGFISVDPDEIALTGCCTEAMNIAANGLPLKKGDEVLLTTHEHVGGALPWLGRRKRDEIVIKTCEPGRNADETMRTIKQHVTGRTRVISVSHVTCTTGAILPVKEITAFARSRNIWSVIDGAQAIGHIPVNIHDIGCDCYATSGHKWLLGPKRTGVLFVKKDMLDTIEPKFIGAYSDEWWDFDKGLKYHSTAQRYEYGTYNVPLMHGLGVAVDFLDSIGLNEYYKRSHTLASDVIGSLSGIPNVEILTPSHPEEFGSIVTVRLKNIDTADLQKFLTDRFRLRTRFVAEAGLNALRISIHIYNSRDEVDRFIQGVKEASRL
jgi:cysteine desulfurase / selenocysteine lyase